MLTKWKPATARVGLVLALCMVWSICYGQISADQRKAMEEEISAMREELGQLEDGVGAPNAYKQYRDLQKKVSKLYSKHQNELKGPQNELSELSRDPKIVKWREKIEAKRQELYQAMTDLQAELHRRGRELHERRKAELAEAAIATVKDGKALGFTGFTYPKVDGSTSAQPLGMVIACKLLGCPYTWSGSARYYGRWHLGGEEASETMRTR